MVPRSASPADIALLKRAGFACEYCRRPIDLEWHREHIRPVAAGGSDDPSNLAVSCPRCNANKGVATHAVDVLTHRRFRLLDPRHDRWEDHLHRRNHYVAGLTPIGRATATLLFRQTPRAQLSVPLPGGVGAPLLDGPSDAFIRWLYAQRKAAQFATLFDELPQETLRQELALLQRQLGRPGGPLPAGGLLTIERAAVLAEALTSRCLIDDLLHAERLCCVAAGICGDLAAAPADERLPYFRTKRALAWRQLAVHFAVSDSIELSRACALASRRLAPTRGTSAKPALGSIAIDLVLGSWSRSRTDLDALWADVCEEAQEGEIARFVEVVDALVLFGSPRDAEELGLLEAIGAVLERSGYGMDADLHHGVLVMRRLLLAQARFAPAEISSAADRHLRDWGRWGATHSLRSLLYGLRFVRGAYGAAADDLIAVCVELDGVVERSEAAEIDAARALGGLC